MRRLAFLLLAVGLTAVANARAPSAVENVSNVPVGVEMKPCKDCPVFVRVPTPPAEMRKISFVAKYELTWNNYLAAVDAGNCPIPQPYRKGIDAERTERSNEVVADHLSEFRIDWPIAVLGSSEIECYIGWLQNRTPYRVSLPRAREWEWFARAGRPDWRFPWGNEVDPHREALPGSEIAPADALAVPNLSESSATPIGVRVGLFPPNPWGIHDLMGNVQELTSDIVPGELWFQRNPDSTFARNTRERDRVAIKGGDRLFDGWETGISDTGYTMIWDGRYAMKAGVRLVLSPPEPVGAASATSAMGIR